MCSKVDAVHAMLGLKDGEAFLNAEHPVNKEYDAIPGSSIRHIFPVKGLAGVQVLTIKLSEPDTNTCCLVTALGDHNLECHCIIFLISEQQRNC